MKILIPTGLTCKAPDLFPGEEGYNKMRNDPESELYPRYLWSPSMIWPETNVLSYGGREAEGTTG